LAGNALDAATAQPTTLPPQATTVQPPDAATQARYPAIISRRTGNGSADAASGQSAQAASIEGRADPDGSPPERNGSAGSARAVAPAASPDGSAASPSAPGQTAPSPDGRTVGPNNDPAIAGLTARTDPVTGRSGADQPKDPERPVLDSKPPPSEADQSAPVPTSAPAVVNPAAVPAPPVIATPVAAAATHRRDDASPAAQVAPALVSLVQSGSGSQRLTLHLDPASLGHVQIQIDRAPDAPARVEITVQRPQTLELLVRDQPQLQHALDQAGVPHAGRTLTLHLASQEPGASAFDAAGSGNAGFGNGSAGHRSAGGSSRNGGNGYGAARSDTETTPIMTPIRSYRAGLDITA
jgi:flagellar hook-length control protein FliK